MVLCFSPSVAFSRLSFHAYEGDGMRCFYLRGPEHSESIEAALLQAWAVLGIPAFVWRLAALDKESSFVGPEHETAYRRARRELCRVLYGIRLTTWVGKVANAGPSFLPPP